MIEWKSLLLKPIYCNCARALPAVVRAAARKPTKLLRTAFIAVAASWVAADRPSLKGRTPGSAPFNKDLNCRLAADHVCVITNAELFPFVAA